MVTLAIKISESGWFKKSIIFVIVFAGLIIGLETYPSIISSYGNWLYVIDVLILCIFISEIIIKIIAKGKNPLQYFSDGWNVFDFLVVVVCFLPVGGTYIAVFRLVRILRVLRLITAIPKLQLLVNALLKSIPSMSYVGILLLLHFYIYAVVGTFLFGKNDLLHFGNLQTSFFTLFKVVTLEGWIQIMNLQIYGSETITPYPTGNTVIAPIYFISFIIFGTMIMLNLFIGVIINSMDEIRKEAEEEELLIHNKAMEGTDFNNEISLMEKQIKSLNDNFNVLKVKLAKENINHRS